MFWGENISSSSLIAGLEPFFTPRTDRYIASDDEDSVYRLGPTDYPEYIALIDEFVSTVLPKRLQREYHDRKTMKKGEDGQGWDGAGGKHIWQTDKNHDRIGGDEVHTWKDGLAQKDGWDWRFMTDEYAHECELQTDSSMITDYFNDHLAGTRLEIIWGTLPYKILVTFIDKSFTLSLTDRFREPIICDIFW